MRSARVEPLPQTDTPTPAQQGYTLALLHIAQQWDASAPFDDARHTGFCAWARRTQSMAHRAIASTDIASVGYGYWRAMLRLVSALSHDVAPYYAMRDMPAHIDTPHPHTPRASA